MGRTLTFSGASTAEGLEFFRDTEPMFTVERTGYSAKVILPDGTKYLFADQPVRPSLFPIAKRLKDEVIQAGVPVVDEQQVTYYGFRQALKIATLPERAWCIDLTAAYTNALFHRRLISGETLGRLQELPKEDRLRVVGMLATTKAVFKYERGKVVECSTVASPTRGAFFAACEAIGELMRDVATHADHLFFWVDGAFFSSPAPEVVDYFQGHGYPCKVEDIKDLRWSRSRKYLFFTKGNDRKYLAVPSGKQPAPGWISELLSRKP